MDQARFTDNLTPPQNELAVCLTEELSETATELLEYVISLLKAVKTIQKTQRFGVDNTIPGQLTSNRVLLSKEIGDVFCLVQRLVDAGIINEEVVLDQASQKNAKLDLWLRYSDKSKVLG